MKIHCKACNNPLSVNECLIDEELCSKCLSVSNKYVHEVIAIDKNLTNNDAWFLEDDLDEDE